VEAIIDGRQSSDLTFAKLTRGLPLSWIEQRKQLGFPAATSLQRRIKNNVFESLPCSDHYQGI
jgi:hypothetical protein